MGVCGKFFVFQKSNNPYTQNQKINYTHTLARSLSAKSNVQKYQPAGIYEPSSSVTVCVFYVV